MANEVFAALDSEYYDWNEVRVTSIRELTAVMKRLNDAQEAATRLKRVLQSVFETHYSFDLELMKKQNIGATVKQLEKYKGTTVYTVAFVTQNALAGHAIPINQGLLETMRVVGVISDKEAKKGTVPGLERIVAKSKGARDRHDPASTGRRTLSQPVRPNNPQATFGNRAQVQREPAEASQQKGRAHRGRESGGRKKRLLKSSRENRWQQKSSPKKK